MKVRVNTSSYYYRHNTRPHGIRKYLFAIGTWGERSFYCSYQKARKEAIRMAIERNIPVIYLIRHYYQ